MHSPIPHTQECNAAFPRLPKHASQRARELQAAARRCGLTLKYPATFNLLRRSFGANLILAGESLETVRQKMRFAMLKDVALSYGDLIRRRSGRQLICQTGAENE